MIIQVRINYYTTTIRKNLKFLFKNTNLGAEHFIDGNTFPLEVIKTFDIFFFSKKKIKISKKDSFCTYKHK